MRRLEDGACLSDSDSDSDSNRRSTVRLTFIFTWVIILSLQLSDIRDDLKDAKRSCAAPVTVECDTDTDCMRRNGGDGR